MKPKTNNKANKMKPKTKNTKKKTYEIFATIDIPHGNLFHIEATSKKEAERIIKRNMKRDVVMMDTYDKTDKYPYEKGYENFFPVYPNVHKKSMKFYLQPDRKN
jgi:hypothetical protein